MVDRKKGKEQPGKEKVEVFLLCFLLRKAIRYDYQIVTVNWL